MERETLEADSLLYQLIRFHFTKDLEWMYDDGNVHLSLEETDPHLAADIQAFMLNYKDI